MKIAPCWILTGLLIALQYVGAINVSWVWLVAPLWFPLIVAALIFGVMLIVLRKEEGNIVDRAKLLLALMQMQQDKSQKRK